MSIYQKLEVTEELLQKLAVPIRCHETMNLNLASLETCKFKELETECKLHGLRFGKQKKYMIRALREHYTSPAHPMPSLERIPVSVKEEKI